ncbi:MAG: hypothetical protein M3R36_16410 [Bacteroidota bacterium]|nr:hypothetical protein [Bacteroidota bacterium]
MIVSQNEFILVDNYFELFQNNPNPFNSSTIIRFRIKSHSFVTLRIYDLIGKEMGNII